VDRDRKILVETHKPLGGLPVIYDISDPANPVELSHVDIPGSAEDSVHDPKLRGSRLLFSWYSKEIIAVSLRKKESSLCGRAVLPDRRDAQPRLSATAAARRCGVCSSSVT